jgi:CubicO group peptidase (beta-lactamase class C family)
MLCMTTGFSGAGANQAETPVSDAIAEATGTVVHHPITRAQVMAYMAQIDSGVFDQSLHPGDTCAYANMSFVVLGRVLGAITGTGFEEWVRDHIFAPLGVPANRVHLYSVTPGDHHEIGYHVSRPVPVPNISHSNPVAGELPPLVYPCYEGNPTAYDAHGSLALSIIDLIRFFSSFNRGSDPPKLMSAQTLHKMWSFPTQWASLPGTNGTNLRGWYVTPAGGRPWYQHNGGTPGTESIAGVRDDGLAFGILMATDTLGNGFGQAQIDWVAQQLDTIRAAGDWPTHDLFAHFGVGPW